MRLRKEEKMGLDTSHDCWHGAYSAFHHWRKELCRAAGLPPLDLMEGFFSDGSDADGSPFSLLKHCCHDEMIVRAFERDIIPGLPISWNCLQPNPLHELLCHSDCDGEIPASSCAGIADSLERLLPKLPAGDGPGHIGNWRAKTQQFIDGLWAAASAGENVEFA